jgi:hypothetical protein
MGGFASPGMPQAPFAPQFQAPQPAPAPAPAQPAVDRAAEEAKRMQEEKDKLEKKINDMEKLLSAEKERALMATLKSQQDENLSSRVESSLKDIQEKMRRDRRDHEIEEERLTLKSKIKELETRLAQERETWMQTLKNQMAERETQGRDVEGHFIYRLQEMERRWLDEKAQWQKEISVREEELRSLKSAAEKLRDTQDELRKVSLEKSMVERDIFKMKDEVARAEREKASIESYIKIIPEKERELAEARAENIQLRAREATAVSENKLREEKTNFEIDRLQKQIGSLQAEIGNISDRKNEEKNEELRKLQDRHESEMQLKEKELADVNGEKVRALSELVKIKGFISRVQAINAVLEKERGQMKLEKMQLAQNMAAQMEEIHRLKQENEGLKGAHQAELETQAANFRAEVERARTASAAELERKHAEDIAELGRTHAAEMAELSRRAQDDLAKASASRQNELAAAVAERQSDFDVKLSQMRSRYESAMEEEKSAVRRQFEGQLRELRDELENARQALAKAGVDNARLSSISADFDNAVAARTKEYESRAVRAEEEAMRQGLLAAGMASQKDEADKNFRQADAERQRVAAEYAALREQAAALREQYAALAAQKANAEAAAAKTAENLRAESENRARFESEMLFLKQKMQQMEFQAQETAAAVDAEHAGLTSAQAAAAEQHDADQARINELSAELERYKAMEASFSDRLKWALKGK